MGAYDYLLASRPIQIPDPLERQAKRLTLARLNEAMLEDRSQRQLRERAMADAEAFRQELASADLTSDVGQMNLLRSALARGPQYAEAAAKIIGQARRQQMDATTRADLERQLRGGEQPPAPAPAPVQAAPAPAPMPVRMPDVAQTSPVAPPMSFDSPSSPARGPIDFAPTPEPGKYAMTEPRSAPEPLPNFDAPPPAPVQAAPAAPAPKPPSVEQRMMRERDMRAEAEARFYLARGEYDKAQAALAKRGAPMTFRDSETHVLADGTVYRAPRLPGAPDEFQRRARDAGMAEDSPEFRELARSRLEQMVRERKATDTEFFQALRAAGIAEGSPEWQGYARRRADQLVRPPLGRGTASGAPSPSGVPQGGVWSEIGTTPDGAPVVRNNKVPGRYVLDDSGTPRPYDGQVVPKSGTQSNEGERTSAGYLARMREAERIIGGLPAEAQRPGGIEAIADTILPNGRVQRAIGRAASSPERQMARQAQEDWVRAKLRKESGAVIADDEMQREIETYFPQPGDSDAVIVQKQQARRMAERQMEISSGRAEPEARPSAPRAVQTPPANRPPLESFRR